jgi:hypothetical protein
MSHLNKSTASASSCRHKQRDVPIKYLGKKKRCIQCSVSFIAFVVEAARALAINHFGDRSP